MMFLINIKLFIFKNEIFVLKNKDGRIFTIFAPQFENLPFCPQPLKGSSSDSFEKYRAFWQHF